jgi:hypothetical protein
MDISFFSVNMQEKVSFTNKKMFSVEFSDENLKYIKHREQCGVMSPSLKSWMEEIVLKSVIINCKGSQCDKSDGRCVWSVIRNVRMVDLANLPLSIPDATAMLPFGWGKSILPRYAVTSDQSHQMWCGDPVTNLIKCDVVTQWPISLNVMWWPSDQSH